MEGSVRQRQRRKWETLAVGDTIPFYVTRPVSGIIGYGLVKRFIDIKTIDELYDRKRSLVKLESDLGI